MAKFEMLVGEWMMEGSHPGFASAVHGRSSFEWLLEGSLQAWRSEWERPGPPSALSVKVAEDAEASGACVMLYADERGVARIYQMRLEGRVWRMWQALPGFSQRMEGNFSEDGDSISMHGELSRDGAQWEQDLDVTYTRMR